MHSRYVYCFNVAQYFVDAIFIPHPLHFCMRRRKDATEDMIARGNVVQGNLYQRLQDVYLKREKNEVLKHALTLRSVNYPIFSRLQASEVC